MGTILSDHERALDFQRRLAADVAERREPWAFGTALFVDSLPRVWSMNEHYVERAGASAEELAAAAEGLHAAAGHEHRSVRVLDEAEGRRLADGFAALGWDVDRLVVMAHRREPDRRADTGGVAEVDLPALRPAREAFNRTQPWATDEDAVQQVATHFELAPGRHFAAVVDGEPVAWCDLYSDGRVAQVENVVTLAEHRGRGHARAVVQRAVDEARAAGHDLVFLVAELDDWPKELYRKLGFDETGVLYVFLRSPG